MPPFIIDHHVTPAEVPAPVAGEDPGGCTWSYRVGAAHATGSAMVRMMVARRDHSIEGGRAGAGVNGRRKKRNQMSEWPSTIEQPSSTNVTVPSHNRPHFRCECAHKSADAQCVYKNELL
ncbi:hypothetical protein Zmor_001818 [Zophobas morio]|uniref:Uncharacterized protein n=1 Tax=Zophobas morio TaxID=2755281 RepID=A0AA38J9T3_9CUCU|nr:hypothetical protein Zmor_001818 [Zophobas morio]